LLALTVSREYEPSPKEEEEEALSHEEEQAATEEDADRVDRIALPAAGGVDEVEAGTEAVAGVVVMEATRKTRLLPSSWPRDRRGWIGISMLRGGPRRRRLSGLREDPLPLHHRRDPLLRWGK